MTDFQTRLGQISNIRSLSIASSVLKAATLVLPLTVAFSVDAQEATRTVVAQPAAPAASGWYDQGAALLGTVGSYTGWALSSVGGVASSAGGYVWPAAPESAPATRPPAPASAPPAAAAEPMAAEPAAVVAPPVVPPAAPTPAANWGPSAPLSPRAQPPAPELPLRTAEIPGVGIVSEQAQKLPDGSLFVPKPAQRMIAVRTERTEIAEVPEAKELMGRVIPDPSHSGHVQATQAGRIHAADSGMPHLGMRVEKGQILAYLEPALPVSERTELLNELASVSTELKAAKERLVRIQSFYVVPFREGKVRLAEIEIDGLRKRYAVLSAMFSRRDELKASASGVISAVNVAAGEVVDPNKTLFEIVDPKRMWVEAVAFDAAMGNAIESATASTVDLRWLTLRYVGSGRSLKNQAVPMHFEVIDPPADLQDGQPLRVVIAGPTKGTGIVVPRRAIVRSGNGDPMVWERTAPERFTPRTVVVESVDAERAVVRAGLRAGVPIVVNGAPLMAQVR